VLVLLVLVGVGPRHAGPAALALVLLVLFVAIHELGHALAARRLGLRVEGIYLHLFPVTYIESAAPHKELLVALAGPAASLLAAGAIAAARAVVPGPWPPLSDWTRDFWMLALLANLAMGLLNLVPVLPADGGRALRAGLSLVWGRQRATRWVAALGLVLGLALAAVALAVIPLPWAAWLAALGLYVAFVSTRRR
jgi:Zn-dependent protease